MPIPRVLWPVAQPGGGTVAPRDDINATATPPAERNASVLGLGLRIPLIYGRTTIGARMAILVVHGADLLILSVVGHGPIDAIESVTIDDKPLPTGAQVTSYLGAAGQTADPWLVAAFAAQGVTYADALPGIAYYVIRIPGGSGTGLPNLLATVRGRLLYDPRSGLTVYSDNPALALADLLSNATYGASRSVDWATVTTVANANDALVGGEKTRTLGLALENGAPAAQVTNTLRTYAGCYVDRSGTDIRLIPDGVASVELAIDESMILENSLRLKKRGVANMPTVMRVTWSDMASGGKAGEAVVELPGVSTGALDRVESSIQLPGVTRYSQAWREGIERLNKLTLADIEAQWSMFDTALRLRVGAVVSLTHSVGLAAKQLRLSRVANRGLGLYDVVAAEYDPAVYSSAVATAPSTSDTDLPDPMSPPAVVGLTLVEEVYQLENGSWASRIAATWTVATWAYIAGYRAELWAGATLLAVGTTESAVWRTGPLQEGVSYTLRVAAMSKWKVGAWADASLTAAGKYLLPGNVPNVTGFEVGGEVRLSISAATDLDMVGYEIHYGPVGCSWALSSTVKFVDFVNAASGVGGYCVFRDAPAGTWDFLVCARDSVGQYSPTPARVTLTVTLDVNAFLVGNHAFTNPTPTGLAEYSLPGDPARYWVTEDGVMAATKFPANPASSYGNVAATYHASQTSEIVTEAWDVGVAVGGNWAGTLSSVALSGSKVDQISLSPDGTTYTDQGSLTAKANGRFGKLKATATGTSTLKVGLPTLALRIDAIPRVENGTVATNASGYTRITLANSYTAVKSLNLTPQGTAARQAVADNIVVNGSGVCSFDVYLFNAAGTQLAGPVLWDWEGV